MMYVKPPLSGQWAKQARSWQRRPRRRPAPVVVALEPVTHPRVLGDYPALLYVIADQIDRELHVGTDMAEQLRGIASELDVLTLVIVARMNEVGR